MDVNDLLIELDTSLDYSAHLLVKTWDPPMSEWSELFKALKVFLSFLWLAVRERQDLALNLVSLEGKIVIELHDPDGRTLRRYEGQRIDE